MYQYTIQIIIGVSTVVYYFKNRKRLQTKYPYLSFLYVVMIVYVVVGFLKQYFIPSGIYPFQRMYIAMAFLSIGSFFFIADEVLLNKTLKLWFKWFPWLFVLVYFVLEQSQYFSYFYLYVFFLLLYPLLPQKKKLIVVVISLFLFMFGIVQRMDVINLVLPVLLTLAYSFRWIKSKIAFIWVNVILLLLPIFFLILANTTSFNILALDQYIGDHTLSSGDKLNVDTRTFLYKESFESAVNNNYVIWGRTPMYGYDSNWQTSRVDQGTSKPFSPIGQIQQRGSEVFIVNMFTWCGVIGLILFFIFFIKISFRAIMYSKNVYMKAMGLYVSCFWFVDWISNNFWGLSMNYILLFIITGMVYSPKIMDMNNSEFRNYFRVVLR